MRKIIGAIRIVALSGAVALPFSGCQPSLRTTVDAVALPLLERDSTEDGVDADCWAGFRGRNAQGIASAGSPATEFGHARGFRWKIEIPGDGWSSPVVWKDRILLTSALDETDPPTLVVLCYDRADGNERWRVEAGPAAGSTHNKNGHASASVATDGERIVAFFGTTGLFCYDLDGNRQWRVDPGNLDHKWGTASSPVIHGDLVIQLCDSEQDSYLAAFDLASGREIWRTPRVVHGCWSTPVVVEAPTDDGARRVEVIVNGGGSANGDERAVTAYSLEDGNELWRVRGLSEWVTPTPMVRDGVVYCASGRNGPILAIRPGGNGDVTDSHVIWKTRRGGPYIPSGVVYCNRVYLVAEAGFLACYNAGSGEQVWRAKARGPFSASLVAAGGRIYATSERGNVYVFAAGDTAEMLATNRLGEKCLATPAVAGGELFIRTAKHLYCVPGD